MSTARFAAVLVTIAFVLSGCAAPANNGVPQLAPDSVEPSDQAQAGAGAQARETGLVAPARVFGGDCAALFSVDDVSKAVGVRVALEDFGTNARGSGSGDEAVIEQLGGIQCAWRADTMPSNYAVAWFVLFPLGALDFETPDAPCGHAPWEEDTVVNCFVDEVRNGIRITGLMVGDGAIATSIEPARAELLALFAERATKAMTAQIPIPAVGAWALPWECQAVVSAADFSSVPGLGSTAHGEGLGGRGGVLPLAFGYLHGEDGVGACSIVGESATVDFVALGGMRWKGAAVTAAADTVTLGIDGLDSVLASKNPDGGYAVEVLDGPNWLEFHVKYTKNAGPIALALVAALDSTAAPE